MQIEYILSDYLASVGATVFLCVAVSELGNTHHIGLPKSALGSLFLLVVGACFGSLASPGEEGPLSSLRAFLGFSDITTLPGLSLLLISMVVIYLATTLTPGEGDLLTRVACAIGALSAVALCAYLLYETLGLGAMSQQGTLLYAIAFVANAITTGYALFQLSCQCDVGARTFSPFERKLTLCACVIQSLPFTVFTASFIVRLSQGINLAPSPAIIPAVATSWLVFAACGPIGTALCGAKAMRTNTETESESDAVSRQRKLLVCLLACSVAAGIALQCIVQLSNTWTI